MRNSNFKSVVAFAAALSIVATSTGVAGVTASAAETDATSTTTTTTKVLGDADLDGKLRANDILIMKKHVLNISELQEGSQAFKNADITGDGKVAANDILLAKKVVLGILDNLDAYETTEATTTTSEAEATTTVDEDDKLDATFSTETDPETGDENTVAAIDVDDDEELPDDVAVYLDGQLLDPQYYSYNPVTGLVTFNNAAIAKDLGLNADDIKKASIYAAPKAEVTTTASETQATTTASETQATTTASETDATSAAVTTTGSSAAVTTTGSSAAVTTTGSSVAAVTTTGSSVAAVTTTGASDVAVTTTGSSVAAVTTTGSSDAAVTTTGSSVAAVTTTGSSDVAAVTTTGASDVAVTTTGASDVAVTTTGASDVAVTTTGASDVAVTTTGASDVAVTTTGSSVAAVTTTGASDVAVTTTDASASVSAGEVTTTPAETTTLAETTTTAEETTEATIETSWTEDAGIVKDYTPTYVYKLTLNKVADAVKVFQGQGTLLTEDKDYTYDNTTGVITMTSNEPITVENLTVWPATYTELKNGTASKTADIKTVTITDSEKNTLSSDNKDTFAIYKKVNTSSSTALIKEGVLNTDTSDYEVYSTDNYKTEYNATKNAIVVTFDEAITEEEFNNLTFVVSVDNVAYYNLSNNTGSSGEKTFKIQAITDGDTQSVTISEDASGVSSSDPNYTYLTDAAYGIDGTITTDLIIGDDDIIVEVDGKPLTAAVESTKNDYSIASNSTIGFTNAQSGVIKVYANVEGLPTETLYDASKNKESNDVTAKYQSATYSITFDKNTVNDYYVVSGFSLEGGTFALNSGTLDKFSTGKQEFTGIVGQNDKVTNLAANLTRYQSLSGLGVLDATATSTKDGNYISTLSYAFKSAKDGFANAKAVVELVNSGDVVLVDTSTKTVVDKNTLPYEVSIDGDNVVVTFTGTTTDTKTQATTFALYKKTTDQTTAQALSTGAISATSKISAPSTSTALADKLVINLGDGYTQEELGVYYNSSSDATPANTAVAKANYNYDAETGLLIINDNTAAGKSNSIVVKKLEDVKAELTTTVASQALSGIKLTSADTLSFDSVENLNISLKDGNNTWKLLENNKDYSISDISKDKKTATITFNNDALKYASLIEATADSETNLTYTTGSSNTVGSGDNTANIKITANTTTYSDITELISNRTRDTNNQRIESIAVSVKPVNGSTTAIDPASIVVKYGDETLTANTDYIVAKAGSTTPATSPATSFNIVFKNTSIKDSNQLTVSSSADDSSVTFNESDKNVSVEKSTVVGLTTALTDKNIVKVKGEDGELAETTNYTTVNDGLGLQFEGILTDGDVEVDVIKSKFIKASEAKTEESATVDDTKADTASTAVATLVAKKLALNVLSNLE